MNQSWTKLEGKCKDIKASSICPFSTQSTFTVGSPISLRTGNEYFNRHSFSFPLIKTPLTSQSTLVKMRVWTRNTCVFLGSLIPEPLPHLWGRDD